MFTSQALNGSKLDSHTPKFILLSYCMTSMSKDTIALIRPRGTYSSRAATSVSVRQLTELIAPAESEPTDRASDLPQKPPPLEAPPRPSIQSTTTYLWEHQSILPTPRSCGEHTDEPVLTIHPGFTPEKPWHIYSTMIPSGSPVDFPSAVVSPMLSSPPQLLVYQRPARTLSVRA